MASDIKFFIACNHFVDNIAYEPDKCPRCYGKGYYLDIYFDSNGKTVLTSGNIKLQQEMLKIMLDKKNFNVFHPLWGSEIDNFIGTKNLNINKMKLEVIIRNALNYLKSVQMNEQLQYKTLTDAEVLDKIESVEINPIYPDGWNVKVTISNIAGELLTQSINL